MGGVIMEHDTKKLLDEYFATRPQSIVIKVRGQLDKPELYAYEKRIGKKLVEMDAIEIVEMLKTFGNKGLTTKTFKTTFRSYATLLSMLRDFFNWYIDNYEIIKNPCNDKRIKGKSATALLDDTEALSAFTTENVESIIESIRNNYTEENADYREAIVRMFYEGFPDAIDIANMKESDIDHDKKTVVVRGHEIQLSDRLYELLVKIHNMKELPAFRGVYVLLSCNDSYFKFPTREKFENEFKDRTPEYWAGHISRLFNRDIKNKMDLNINGRTLYLCGLYDYMVKRIGREETNQILRSVGKSEETKALMELAKEYNVTEKNSTLLKMSLLPFVKDE